MAGDDSATDTIGRAVGELAIAAPALHVLSDLLEWVDDGFSPLQLWINYFAFLPMPALMIGLYAVQRPRIAIAGLVGASVYGGTFVYFAHTTLLALEQSVPDYETLWRQLGPIYTVHGAAMIAGGLAFGWASWRAAVLPRLGSALFVAGLVVNLALGLFDLPDLLQTIGSTIRNAGLAVMGWALLRGKDRKSPRERVAPA